MKDKSQTTLFEQPKLRRNDGRFCTEEQYRIDRIEEENKRLRLDRDMYYRMYISVAKNNARITRELMSLKSKIQDLI